MGLKDFFKSLAKEDTHLPAYFRVPDPNTDTPGPGNSFKHGENYFTVTLNQMYLATSRKWFSVHEPMVFSISEYIYGSGRVEVPMVVGTEMIKSKMKNTPRGMIFENTRIAGIHPYVGDRITISIALYRSETKNYLTDSISFLEKLAGVFHENISAIIKNVVKISNVVLEGIDTLVDGGAVQPVFGWNLQLDPAISGSVAPGYFVMINNSQTKWDANKFFVKKGKLYYGNDVHTEDEFRNDDYILFSLNQQAERGDYQVLPVYQSYQKIVEFASQFAEISDEDKKKIGAMMRALNFEMMKSPDLVPTQAKKLMDKFYSDLKEAMETKYNFGGKVITKEKNFWTEMDAKIASM